MGLVPETADMITNEFSHNLVVHTYPNPERRLERVCVWYRSLLRYDTAMGTQNFTRINNVRNGPHYEGQDL